MAGLGTTTDPRELVPGNVAAVRSEAEAMTARAGRLDDAADALARVRVPGWSGEAAEAFADALAAEPRSFRTTADALTSAASALTGYADVLAGAQVTAGRAIDLWAQGQASTAEAERVYEAAAAEYRSSLGTPTPTPSPAPFADPGAQARAEASAMLAEARSSVADAGDAAAEKLGEIVVSDRAIVHDEAGWKGPDLSGSASGSVFSVDPATGEVTLDLAKAEGQASLFSGEASTRATYGSLFAGAAAGTMLGAKGEAKAGVAEGTFQLSAEGSAGLHGDASAEAGFEHGKVGVSASGLAGAYAEAGVELGKNGASVGAGAFAGAKGEVGAQAEIAGVGAEASAEGWAGVGAEADAGAVRNKDGSWTVRAKAGAAYGLGGSVSVGVTVDPEGVMDAAEDAADFIGGLMR